MVQKLSKNEVPFGAAPGLKGSSCQVGAWPRAAALALLHPSLPAMDRRSRPPWLPAVQAGSPLVPKPRAEAFPALGSATPQRPCNGFLVGVV
ncbi:hypothetical protein QTO34_000993, partial [Cnephaeus nilssonii]